MAGTNWEWAVLRPENGTFDTPDYADVYARQKWFYQAQIESPAMFARAPGAGSLAILGRARIFRGKSIQNLTIDPIC
jgi:hypothetical protein